jgi:hypothetical protein
MNKLRIRIIHKLGGFVLEDKLLPAPIRTATIMTFWTYGHPKLSMQINVPMQSGKTAIYELTKIEKADGVDWYWLDLTFVAYIDQPQQLPL